MGIGIIGALVTIGLIIWQVYESKTSGLLRIAREAYEDRPVRYEGRVTYVDGPFGNIRPGEDVFLSVLDGVVCVTSKKRDLHVVEESAITVVNTHSEGDRTLVDLQFESDAGQQRLCVSAKQARAQMIAGVVR